MYLLNEVLSPGLEGRGVKGRGLVEGKGAQEGEMRGCQGRQRSLQKPRLCVGEVRDELRWRDLGDI